MALYTYLSVSNELHKNLDASISKVVNALDIVISRNQNDIQQIKPKQNYRKVQDKFALLRELEEMRFVELHTPNSSKRKVC